MRNRILQERKEKKKKTFHYVSVDKCASQLEKIYVLHYTHYFIMLMYFSHFNIVYSLVVDFERKNPSTMQGFFYLFISNVYSFMIWHNSY